MKNLNRCSLFAFCYSLFSVHSLLLALRCFQASLLIFHFSFLILLTSCSPAKRLENLVQRHPELKVADTLILRDTLITPGIQADTTLHIERLYDTVTIEKERLQVKLLRKLDTLYLSGNCKPDTIFYEKKIPVEKIKLVKEPFNIYSILWLLIPLLILWMLFRRLGY